jgi:ATP-dependent DNA helicase RecG
MPAEKTDEISPLQYIKGVGPVRAKALAEAGMKSIRDLLFNIPRTYIDRSMVSSLKALSVQLRQEFVFSNDIFIKQISLTKEVTLIATVERKNLHEYGRNKKLFTLYLTDGSGDSAKIVFWNYADYYNKLYEVGEWVVISGKPELNMSGKIEFNHPEIEKFDPEDQKIYVSGGILPVYKLPQALKNAKMNMRQLRLMVYSAINSGLKDLKETLTPELLNKFNYPDLQSSISTLHFPESQDKIERALNRMKFEEIFFFELYLAIRQN